MNQLVITARDARHIVLTWWLNLFFSSINCALHDGWTNCQIERNWATSLQITRRYPPQFVLDHMKKLGYMVEVNEKYFCISWSND